MTFTHVFGPAGISASPERVRDPNPLLRSQLEVLPRIPAVGCAETAALSDDPFHAQSLSEEGEHGKAEGQSLERELSPREMVRDGRSLGEVRVGMKEEWGPRMNANWRARQDLRGYPTLPRLALASREGGSVHRFLFFQGRQNLSEAGIALYVRSGGRRHVATGILLTVRPA